MARLIRWDPFSEFRHIMTNWPMDFELENDYALNLAIDVIDETDAIIIKADMPGFSPEDVDITVTTDAVTISAEKDESTEVTNETYIRRERRHGKVARTVALHHQVMAKDAEATFEDGTMTLHIPKMVEENPERVKITPKRKE